MINIYIKDIIELIEKYSNIKNIYNNYNDNNIDFEYKCDNCKCNFNKVTIKNKIIYEMNNFDNNIFNKFDNLIMSELFILNNINFYNIKYKKVSLIFCNLCIYNVNKKTENLNIFMKCFLEYISYDFYQYIKLNNYYFIKDKIFREYTLFKRIMMKKNSNNIDLNYISISNSHNINFNNLKKINYNILNKILLNNFGFNINYIINYLSYKNQ